VEDFSNHPMMLDAAEALRCVGNEPQHAASMQKRHNEWQREFAFLSQLPSWAADMHDFQWARLVVLTRAFSLPLSSKLPNARKDIAVALVPFADMLNHARTKNVDWQYISDGFEIRALPGIKYASIQAGAQVFHSYGKKSNVALLTEYGFVGAPSLRDVVSVKVGSGETQYTSWLAMNTVRTVLCLFSVFGVRNI
jgi:hypothetical protein